MAQRAVYKKGCNNLYCRTRHTCIQHSTWPRGSPQEKLVLVIDFKIRTIGKKRSAYPAKDTWSNYMSRYKLFNPCDFAQTAVSIPHVPDKDKRK
jgi:hypothetical protein